MEQAAGRSEILSGTLTTEYPFIKYKAVAYPMRHDLLRQ
jgi:hypothetical protein